MECVEAPVSVLLNLYCIQSYHCNRADSYCGLRVDSINVIGFVRRLQMLSTLFLIITLWSLLTCCTGTPEAVPFPTCLDVYVEKCAFSSCITGKSGGVADCVLINAFSIHTSLVRISLSYTGEYSSSNVLCINYNNSSAAEPPYRLQGCPNGFFNTSQNTSGVCSISAEDNTTGLLLISYDWEPALYSFICLYASSPNHAVLSNAIVGKLNCSVTK